MILGLLIYFATLAIDLITDYRIWAGKRTVNHLRGAILRAAGLVPAVIFMGWWSLGLVAFYWPLFDCIYGVLIARSPLFLGTTSKLDRLQRQYPALVVAKFILGIGGLVLFILKSF